MNSMTPDTFKLLVDKHPRAMMVTRTDARIIYVNHHFREITGYRCEEVVGKTPSLLSSGLHSPEFYRTMWESITTRGQWEGMIWNRRKSGDHYPQWLNIHTLDDGKEALLTGVFIDVSEMQQFDSQLASLAYYDPLTRLPNRSLFSEFIGVRVKQRYPTKSPFAVIFIDVDHFKTINDLHGHAVGDAILNEVAKRLRSAFREGDLVARLSGDEFAAIVDLDERDDSLSAIRVRLTEIFKAPMTVGGRDHFVSISAGTALCPEDGASAGELLEKADKAMYSAKRAGRARVCAYDSRLTAELERKQRIGAALSESLRRNTGQFSVHYQPQYCLATDTPVGLEALLRWRHSELGCVSPAEFIPIAEARNLIHPLTEILMELILSDLSAPAAPAPAPESPLCLALNLSAGHIWDERLPPMLAELTHRLDQLGWQTEIEITETQLMHLSEINLSRLQQISDGGIRIAIDDFGTGYSSLAYLHKLPVDTVKVDRQFVQRLVPNGSGGSDSQVVLAILALARALGLSVIAEGIETADQRQALIDMGCTLGQGFYLACPKPWRDTQLALTHRGARPV